MHFCMNLLRKSVCAVCAIQSLVSSKYFESSFFAVTNGAAVRLHNEVT